MNPVLRAAIESILRHLLTGLAAYLVTRGIWTPEEASTYVAALALVILSTGWGIWHHTKVHALIVRALRMPADSTLDELHDAAAKGEH